MNFGDYIAVERSKATIQCWVIMVVQNACSALRAFIASVLVAIHETLDVTTPPRKIWEWERSLL